MAGLVQYNFTIDDASPVFSYSPYSDFASTSGHGDGLHNGWQTWYTESGFLSDSGGPTPRGESFHLTSLSGASVSLSFYGTGVVLYGTSNCSAYDVTFDGSLVSGATLVQGVFFSTSDEEAGFHNVSLTARPDSDDQVFSFNSAIVISVANTTVNAPVYSTIDNQNTSAITYTGDWDSARNVPNIPSSASPAPFHSTTASSASASLNFTGRAVAVYGSSTTNHGQYAITMDGVRQVFNGTSEWLLGNMLMFYQDGFDENSTHSLNLTNLSDETLSLNSVQITHFDSAPTGSTSSDVKHGTPNVGAIVGPIIASVVIASVIGLYIWSRCHAKHTPNKIERRSSIASSIFLPRRFRRKHSERGDALTPYVVNFSPAHLDTSGSFASLDAGAPGHPNGNVNTRDEKVWPIPMPVVVSTDTGRVISSVSAERQPPDSVPATYLRSELDIARIDTTQSPGYPHAPTYPPRTSTFLVLENSNVVSPVRSNDPSLVERILELVAQRIDVQRPSTNTHLPPYPEDV